MSDDEKIENTMSKKKKILTAIGWIVVFILLYFSYVVIDVNTDDYSNNPSYGELGKARN